MAQVVFGCNFITYKINFLNTYVEENVGLRTVTLASALRSQKKKREFNRK